MGAPTITDRLRALARRLGISSAVRAILRRLGFDLLRRHYHSPVPDLTALPDDIWTRESKLSGLRFDAVTGLKFIESELSQYLAEYTPPRASTGNPRDFYLDNGELYESVDAETLYAMVRRFSPRRVIELGSGFSTLVIADARARNERSDTRHLVYDPYPRPDLLPVLDTVAEVHRTSAMDVPMAEFSALQAGDILFVDTSHTVKLGGEVNRVVLEILPVLAPGVLIHIHDIFIPWEYPRHLPEMRNHFWTEQYLVQAFLAFNQEYDILFSAHALQRRFPDAIARLVPSARPETCPAAFWLRRTS